MARVDVTTWSLEMRDPVEPEARTPASDAGLDRARRGAAARAQPVPLHRGRRRVVLARPAAVDLRALDGVARPSRGRDLGRARARGSPAGYFELERQDGGDVEIAYFGLLPSVHRQGHRRPPARHRRSNGHGRSTAPAGSGCTPAASTTRPHCANYQARGLEVFEVETEPTSCPTSPRGRGLGRIRRPRGTGGSRLDR